MGSLQFSIIQYCNNSIFNLNQISLHNTLPLVFAQRSDNTSELWLQNVSFERGHLYLIEAASGTGKSSLCAYLTGYRRDYSGAITFHDDLHLLPFDGTGDWPGIARRLARCRFAGPLTFELSCQSHPGRHENDAYARLSPAEYLTEAYKRACRVAALVLRARDET